MVSPARYRQIVVVAGALLALIMFTGAAVRLTESGLGCEDWPTCSDTSLTPEWTKHGLIEFGNRLLSGVVGLGTIATVIGARRRDPRRADLERWSWFLVLGVAAQVVLGGVTVLVELHPLFVSSHFLLSIVLLFFAIVLWAKAQDGAAEAQPKVPTGLRAHSRALPILASVLVVSGTIVTGTGPNSGDFRADRFNLDLTWVARTHGVIAWSLVAALVAYALRRQKAGLDVGAVSKTLALAVAQGGIGYWQYFIGVPPLLVMVHVIGSVFLWCAVLLLHVSDVPPPAESDGSGDRRDGSGSCAEIDTSREAARV